MKTLSTSRWGMIRARILSETEDTLEVEVMGVPDTQPFPRPTIRIGDILTLRKSTTTIHP